MRRRRLLRYTTALGVGAVGLSSTTTAGSSPPSPAGAGRVVERGEPVTEYIDEVPDGPTVELETVAEGGDGRMEKPLGVVPDGGADRRFVFDGYGMIYVHDEDGLREEPFLDLRDRMLSVNGMSDEHGLLGFALHPEFADNGRFYVRYSAPNRPGTPDDHAHTAVIAEFESTEDRESGDPDSERTIIEVPEPQPNHNSGMLAFGPDGYLYATFGDGGDFGDEAEHHVEDWYDANNGGNAQSTDRILGSVLRLDVDSEPTEHPRTDPDAPDGPDGAAGYAIPEDNPLVDDEEGRDELYAWGLRNPWGRLAFRDGDLFLADVGQDLAEEINLVEKGGNYGWNVKEGTFCFSTDQSNPYYETRDDCPDETPDGNPLTDPIVELRHNRDMDNEYGTALVGGFVYEGDGDLDGAYIFGNFSESYGNPMGALFAAHPPESEDDSWSVEKLQIDSNYENELHMWVLGFGTDDGAIYLTGRNEFEEGVVSRIVLESDDGGDGDNGDDGDDGDDGNDSDDETGADDDADDGSDGDDIPGFGIGTAVAGLAGAGAWLKARVSGADGTDDSRVD